MTLKKIAELANTSPSTVSKAFAGSPEISAYTRERIFRIAKELGYFEKYCKLKRSRPLIALLLPEVESEYYARIAGALEHEIETRGGMAVMACTRFQPQRAAALFGEMAYKTRVDGIIVEGSAPHIKNPDHFPLVSFGVSKRHPENADKLCMDVEGGICELVGLIKEYGYKRVGFLGESLTRITLNRLKAALRHHGLPYYQKYTVMSEERFTAAGEQGFLELLRRGGLPEVIIAAYDYIAYGAMKQARLCGYRIPEDLCFAGINDITPSSILDVPLTSLRTNFEEIASTLVDLLFKRIEDPCYSDPIVVRAPVTVCLRESLCRAEERGQKPLSNDRRKDL